METRKILNKSCADSLESERQAYVNLVPVAATMAISLAVLVAILLPPYPPLQDFIEWAYQAAILARSPSEIWPQNVRLADYPIPNSLFQVILAGLTLGIPASIAMKIYLVLYTITSSILAFLLARRYKPNVIVGATCIMLLVFFYNAPFWNGYGGYQIGLLIFMTWLLLPVKSQASLGLVLTFGVIIFFAHAIIFAAFVALVGIQAVMAKRLQSTLLALTPSLALLIWYMLAKEPTGLEEADAGYKDLTIFLAQKAYTLAKIGPYKNFVFETGGDGLLHPIVYWMGVGINIFFAVGLLTALVYGFWRVKKEHAFIASPLVAALLLLSLFMILPPNVLGLTNTSERLLYPALLLLFLFLPLPKRLTQLLGAFVLVLVASLISLALPQHWWSPVTPDKLIAFAHAKQMMFRHRPSAFSCKWQELQRLEAEGGAARLPITFRTSVLIGEGGQECDTTPRALPVQ